MPVDGPNVLIVVLDDVGVDQVSPYEYPGAPPTPTLQSLADSGLRFDQAWAMPVCSPTRAALLTGRMPQRNHIGAVIKAPSDDELPLDEITLPEMLARAATPYSSAAVGKWHLATVRSPSGVKHPLLQGFDLFAGSMNNIAVPVMVQPNTERSFASWERVDYSGRLEVETTFSTTKIVDDAIEALGKLKAPWLLYVAFHAAHRPLMVPPAELTGDFPVNPDNERSLYAANVVAADHELGRLLDALGSQRDDTLVFAMGDNGTPTGAKDEDGQDGGKGSFTEGGVRVPFIVSGPTVSARGETAALVHVVDVFPTLMELAGVRSVDATLDGVSLVPILKDASVSVHKRLYTELRHPAQGPPWSGVERAARDQTLKLVVDDGGRKVYRIDGFEEQEVPESSLSPAEHRRIRQLALELGRHP